MAKKRPKPKGAVKPARPSRPAPRPAVAARALVPATPAIPVAPRRVSVTTSASSAYMRWLNDGIRLGRLAMNKPAQPSSSEDSHMLAALVSRDIALPDGSGVSIDLAPVYDPNRRAYAPGLIVTLADDTANPAAMMNGGGQSMAFALPYPLTMIRAADAVAWLVSDAIGQGRLDAGNQQAVAMYMSAAAAVATPTHVRLSPGVAPLSRDALLAYTGFGADASDEPVDPSIAQAPTVGGVTPLPTGTWLGDDPADVTGARLEYGLAEVRDCTAGLWLVDAFQLDDFVAQDCHNERKSVIARTCDLVRAVDDALAAQWARMEMQLRASMTPPAQIAEEGERLRALRQSLREPRTAQDELIVLGSVLFQMEQPPAAADEQDDA